MTFRILVTAAGGTLAPLNIRLLKESQRHQIWVLGVDTRADATGRYFADAFAQVPDGASAEYPAAILALIVKHRINLVLPWADEEALSLAAVRKQIKAEGAILACAPLPTLQTMSNKVATYELLTKAGIRMPAWVKIDSKDALKDTVEWFAKERGEFAVKPVTARGNRGTIVVRRDVKGAHPYLGSRELHMDFDTYRQKHLDAALFSSIVMERLFPPAYDIDVLARDGHLLRAMPRRRLNPAGIPFTGGVLMPTTPLLELAARITRAFNLSWLYDYDLMTDADGMAIPIEINPRSSGSIAASVIAGVPFYDDLISLAKGEALPEVTMPGEVAVIPYMDCRVIASGQLPK